MSDQPPDKVKYDYIKSNLFRTARADGMWGGVNGFYDIVLNFYSERPPIPQRVVHPLTQQGLGQELLEERVIRDAVVREVEISLSMTQETAKAVRDWLDERIKLIDEMKAKGQGKT